MSENVSSRRSGLLYNMDDKPPLGLSIILGFQHLIASFGGIVAVPLVIGQALGLPVGDIAFLVSATIFVSGITTFIQARGIGPVGAKVPCVMGTDITFVGPMLAVGTSAGMGLGLPGMFGATIMGSFVEIILSRFLKPLMKFFPPVVTGTVVTLIGVSLIPVSIDWAAGGAGKPGYGSLQNIVVAIIVLLIIIFLNRYGKGILGSASVLIGIVAGYIICYPLGMLDFQPVIDAKWFSLPQIFRFGIDFTPKAVLPFLPAYLAATIGTVGVLIATGEVAERPLTNKEIADGVLADGVGSMIAGFFGAGPNTSFSQNVGLIPLTKVASRFVVIVSGIILALLGLFPKFGALISIMPDPVLGGAGLVMFGVVAASGIKTLGRINLNNRNILIIAVSVGLGLGVAVRPEFVAKLPEALSMIFSSGVSTGTVVALILNVVLKEDDTVDTLPDGV
ncbi:xanthine permease PbuX [Gottschalkia purinilytica]|uniref:Xanthine permease PbuX n=1 Tax=Gottschalkia purinilytica TaxID=1503 RepID=A0A0L0W665_GOTPU|nr:nucleobase:cation symporter-2 family protein [Gottschalkia purinilytica]KNF06962.1 xanthine permease PbuX [Gottschalkia purinilytica]